MNMTHKHLAYGMRKIVESGLLSPETYLWDERAIVGTPRVPTYRQLASELSLLDLGGQWFVGKRSVTWVYGTQFTAYLCHPKAKAKIQKARALVHKITGEEDPPYSIPACARRGLKWVGLTQEPRGSGERLLEGVDWHYQLCRPGYYARAWLWDIRGCYYTLLCRAKSPILYLLEDEVLFDSMRGMGAELERWRSFLHQIRAHKGMRNSLVGSMAKDGGGKYWHNGKELIREPGFGPLRPLALWVVRIAAELTYLAALETKAVYANTDAVITEYRSAPPEIWERTGMKVKLVAAGDADIRGLGIYRVGDHETAWYDDPKASLLEDVEGQTIPIVWSKYLDQLGRVAI